MLLIPAIDLLDGKVVRLHQGRFDQVTTYPVDPIAYAAELRGQVERLHIVDLEASRSGGAVVRTDTLQALVAAFGPGVQVGGGVRTADQAKRLFDLGVSRVVLGTAAVREPTVVETIASYAPGQVILAVDARDGWVAIDGWTTGSMQRPADVAARFIDLDLDSLLFTDIQRDGTRAGPAIESTATLHTESGRSILASGGVGHLDHLTQVRSVVGVLGIVVGRALLDRVFTLTEAVEHLR